MIVRIPSYTDHWARGHRLGKVVKTYSVRVEGPNPTTIERAEVRLDRNGKTARVTLEDCEVVS